MDSEQSFNASKLQMQSTIFQS